MELLSHRIQLESRSGGGPPEESGPSLTGMIYGGGRTYDIDLTCFSSDAGTIYTDVLGRTHTVGPVLRHDTYSAGGWTSSTGDVAYASIPDNTLTLAQHLALDIGTANGAAYGGWHPISLAAMLQQAIRHGLQLQLQPDLDRFDDVAQLVRESGIQLDQISVLGFSSAYSAQIRAAFGDAVRIITHIGGTYLTASAVAALLPGLRADGTSVVSLHYTMPAAEQVAATALIHAAGMKVRAWDGTTDASNTLALKAGNPDYLASDAWADAMTLLATADGIGTGDTDSDGATDLREFLTGVASGDSVHLPREIWQESETQPGDGPRMWRGRLTPSAASEAAGRTVSPWPQWSLDGTTWTDMPRSRVTLRYPIPSDPLWQLTANAAGNSYPIRLGARRWALTYP